MDTESFLKKVSREIAELRARDSQLAAQERGVRQKRQEIAEQIDRLDSAILVYQSLMAVEGPPHGEDAPVSSEQTVTILNPEEAARMTIAEAAAVILETLGGEASTQTIVAELKAVGKANGSNPINTISTQLRRFPERFEWVSRGRWRLAPPRIPTELRNILRQSPLIVHAGAATGVTHLEAGNLMAT